jgi:hypothetical protein
LGLPEESRGRERRLHPGQSADTGSDHEKAPVVHPGLDGQPVLVPHLSRGGQTDVTT